MEPSYPVTVIIRDPRENPRKCSILPLKDRPDLRILTHPLRSRPSLEGYVRLAAEGPELTPADAGCGLLLLDGSWRRADRMARHYLDIPPRSLRDYQTAYPRISHLGTDPGNGLATVEALYLAYRILGRDTTGLLDHYRWAEEFLRRNGFLQEIAGLPADPI